MATEFNILIEYAPQENYTDYESSELQLTIEETVKLDKRTILSDEAASFTSSVLDVWFDIRSGYHYRLGSLRFFYKSEYEVVISSLRKAGWIDYK